MITIKIDTKTNHWYTNVNTDLEGTKKYFLGKFFNIGIYPAEKMEKVNSVIQIKS